ncbi:MAG: PEP-CTERM sorting domain-containing protein [Pyrinomonadaceae bacterium]
MTIDPLTGRATDVNPDDNSCRHPNPSALTFSTAGTLYSIGNSTLTRIDTTSGVVQFIGVTGANEVQGITFIEGAAEPIPEPTTLLLGTGLASFGLSLRRRRRAQPDADTWA